MGAARPSVLIGHYRPPSGILAAGVASHAHGFAWAWHLALPVSTEKDPTSTAIYGYTAVEKR